MKIMLMCLLLGHENRVNRAFLPCQAEWALTNTAKVKNLFFFFSDPKNPRFAPRTPSKFVRGLLGTGPPDPTLESASPFPPQGSVDLASK